jgi:hypothetical protein
MLDRQRYDRHKEQRLSINAAYAKAHPENVAAIKKSWAERNPEKRKAHIAVANALRDGKLEKGPCQLTWSGSCRGRIEAHHEDYSKPLEVLWFCSKHHGELRQKMREEYLIDIPPKPAALSSIPPALGA